MGWRDLLSTTEEVLLPWMGGRRVTDGVRTWKIQGRTPPEHGWYHFSIDGGRKATFLREGMLDPNFEDGRTLLRGYLTGNRFIPDDAQAGLDPDRLAEETQEVFIVEPGLQRFARAVVTTIDERLVFLRQEFPLGPEFEVEAAFEDRLDAINHIPGVTPALDVTFHWLHNQRRLAEEREAERQQRLEQERLETERLARIEEARTRQGTAVGRRALAQADFREAARAALAMSNAELLDVRDSVNAEERTVRYRYRGYRLECVVHHETLRIIDSGICLTDHHTGERGDTYFTLESLPAVVGHAIDQGVLHIWRHG